MSGDLAFPSPVDVIEARQRGEVGSAVESVLRALQGQPLKDLRRAADMIVLGFGDEVLPEPTKVRSDVDADRRARVERRNATPLARYRLHIQCPFRLDSPSGPFLGGHDIYRRAAAPHEPIEGRDFNDCLFDLRAKEGSELEGPPLVVEDASADSGGGFVLSLSEGWTITVAPASAVVREFWRLFDAAGGDHFVIFRDVAG